MPRVGVQLALTNLVVCCHSVGHFRALSDWVLVCLTADARKVAVQLRVADAADSLLLFPVTTFSVSPSFRLCSVPCLCKCCVWDCEQDRSTNTHCYLVSVMKCSPRGITTAFYPSPLTLLQSVLCTVWHMTHFIVFPLYCDVCLSGAAGDGESAAEHHTANQ